MPRAASGSFTASASSWNPAVTGEAIDPTDWNLLLADITAELTDSLSRSGKGAAKANLSMGGYKLRLLGLSTSAGDAMSRSAADIRYQPLDTQLTALASLAPGSGDVPYFTASNSASKFSSTIAGRSIAGVTGVADKVPYYTSSSSASSTSAPAATRALWRLVAAADKIPYFSGSSSAASTSFTAAGRTLLRQSSASAQALILIPGLTAGGKALVGVTGIAGKVPYYTASNSASSASATAANRAIWRLTGAASQLPYYTSSSSATSTSFTAAGRAMLRASSASAQTALLAAFIGATTSAAGIKGLVPAPSAGDNTKFLRGDGSYAAVTSSAGGDVTGPASSVNNGIPRFSGTGGKTLKSSSATLSDTGRLSRTGGIHVQGTNTNDSTSAGYVGETISSVISSTSATTLTTNVPKKVTSIQLTAGDWDLWGAVSYKGGATTAFTYGLAAVATSSAACNNTLGATYFGFTYFPSAPTVFATFGSSQPPTSHMVGGRISLNSTTTYYLVSQAGFTTASCAAFGSIFARRRR